MGAPDNQEAVISQETLDDCYEAIDDQAETEKYHERRKWPRFPDKEFSRAWFSTPNQGAQSGRVLDIGLGGICLKVVNTSGLKIGQKVVLGLGEWMIPAKVANIVPNGNATYRLGLEWVRPESTGVAMLVEQCCIQAEFLDDK